MAIGHWNESVTDLIPAYRATRRALNNARDNAKRKAKEWEEVRQLLPRDKRAEAANQARGWEAQAKEIGELISNVEYVLEWLEHGGNPSRRRGAEKSYKVKSWDPAWLDAYHSPHGWTVQRESRELTQDERFRIEEAMRDLTDRERQCFLMYHVDGMSEYDIALELHLGRSTVQEYLIRAKRKIEEAKASSLFLIG